MRRFLEYLRSSGLWFPVAISVALTAVIYAIMMLASADRTPLPTISLQNPDDIKSEEMLEVAQRHEDILTLIRGMHREVSYCYGGYRLAAQVPAGEPEAAAQTRASAAADCETSKANIGRIEIPAFRNENMNVLLGDSLTYCRAAIAYFQSELATENNALDESTDARRLKDCYGELRDAGEYAGQDVDDLQFLALASEEVGATEGAGSTEEAGDTPKTTN